MKGIHHSLLLLFLISFLLYETALSRDINLDDIYVKRDDFYSKKLFESKLEAYLIAQSQCLDRNVIFADWLNGFEILYIKEINNLNIAYIHHRKTQRVDEFIRFDGTITACKVTPGGRYLLVKRILLAEDGMPSGDALCIDMITRKKTKVFGNYPFLDFSITPGGNTVLIAGKDGVREHSLSTGASVMLMKKTEYADINTSDAPTIAFLSPNRKKALLINGSGGSYQAKIMTGMGNQKLTAITSATELFWISNNEIAYRTGGPGNFSVAVYDTKTQAARYLLENTLHASINFSSYAKFISFLKDQIICFYDVRQNSFYATGLEGDDVSFSPDGNRFTSILYQRLFLTNRNTLLKKQNELQKVHRETAVIYKKLLDTKKLWENEYSETYLKRKISIYTKLSEFKRL